LGGCGAPWQVTTSGGALQADTSALIRQLAAVLHQITAGAGELVDLRRQHPDGQILTGQVRPWQVELGLERIGVITKIGCGFRTACLQRLQAQPSSVAVSVVRGVS